MPMKAAKEPGCPALHWQADVVCSSHCECAVLLKSGIDSWQHIAGLPADLGRDECEADCHCGLW